MMCHDDWPVGPEHRPRDDRILELTESRMVEERIEEMVIITLAELLRSTKDPVTLRGVMEGVDDSYRDEVVEEEPHEILFVELWADREQTLLRSITRAVMVRVVMDE